MGGIPAGAAVSVGFSHGRPPVGAVGPHRPRRAGHDPGGLSHRNARRVRQGSGAGGRSAAGGRAVAASWPIGRGAAGSRARGQGGGVGGRVGGGGGGMGGGLRAVAARGEGPAGGAAPGGRRGRATDTGADRSVAGGVRSPRVGWGGWRAAGVGGRPPAPGGREASRSGDRLTAGGGRRAPPGEGHRSRKPASVGGCRHPPAARGLPSTGLGHRLGHLAAPPTL